MNMKAAQRDYRPGVHTKSPDPPRAAILAESVASPNVESPRDLRFAPLGSNCTVRDDTGRVIALMKTAPGVWSGRTGAYSDAEVFRLGVSRLSLGPVLRRSETR